MPTLNLLKTDIKVVGIHGKAGSGKDFIAKQCMPDYFRVALADHFKVDIVRKNIFSFDEVFHTKPDHVRHALQRIGTEEGRDVYGEDVWCNTLEIWMHLISNSNNIRKFVITDVRFDNEARYIKTLGGTVIKVLSNRTRCGMDAKALQHSSELGICEDLVDCVVVNDIGTDIETLQSKIHPIL